MHTSFTSCKHLKEMHMFFKKWRCWKLTENVRFHPYSTFQNDLRLCPELWASAYQDCLSGAHRLLGDLVRSTHLCSHSPQPPKLMLYHVPQELWRWQHEYPSKQHSFGCVRHSHLRRSNLRCITTHFPYTQNLRPVKPWWHLHSSSPLQEMKWTYWKVACQVQVYDLCYSSPKSSEARVINPTFIDEKWIPWKIKWLSQVHIENSRAGGLALQSANGTAARGSMMCLVHSFRNTPTHIESSWKMVGCSEQTHR